MSAPRSDLHGYFMPYQKAWLEDGSRFKIWEKSRRVGATWTQSFEDVLYCLAEPKRKVYFSSADESAAKEYIDYCGTWCEVYNASASIIDGVTIDLDNDITATAVHFPNGSHIFAMSSSPRRFRSKGGKVVLDEFAWHDDPAELWAAAQPAITWGFPIRILSTYNGASNLYAKFCADVRKGILPWALHSVPIVKAVDEGLADRIARRPLSEDERAAWIEEIHRSCNDDTIWQQEYCCVPCDESTAFLPYDLIRTCEKEDILTGLDSITGDMFVGVDIGRKHDLTVIWVIEKLGPTRITRYIKVLENAPFHVQRDALWMVLGHRKMRRTAIDATGLGMQLAEEAVNKFGEYRVEAVTFSNRVKEDIAYTSRRAFDDRTVLVPSDPDVREDLHAVRRVTTSAGNVRFDAERTDRGHADRFWAMGLSLHACGEERSVPLIVSTGNVLKSSNLLKGY